VGVGGTAAAAVAVVAAVAAAAAASASGYFECRSHSWRTAHSGRQEAAVVEVQTIVVYKDRQWAAEHEADEHLRHSTTPNSPLALVEKAVAREAAGVVGG
jgi:archaellin